MFRRTVLFLIVFLAVSSRAQTSLRDEIDQRIATHRQGEFQLTLTDSRGRPLPDTEVELELTRHAFLFGTAVNANWLESESPEGQFYREFILEHFNAVVAENAMKWPQTEPAPGVTDFAGADLLADFAATHHLTLRGHCLFWSKEKWQSDWVRSLEGTELRTAVKQRLENILPRYQDQIRDWDANNEMLDGSFFITRDPGIREFIFQESSRIAPKVRLFTNEYGILDSDEKTGDYLRLIQDLQEGGAPVAGIGIQEHAAERFADTYGGGGQVERNSPAPLRPREVWKRLDRLAETGLPIHITEVSFATEDRDAQANALESFYRTAFAHPDVEAFFLWGFWRRAHWLGEKAALVRADGSLTPAAETLSRLLREEWVTRVSGRTDAQGVFRFRGFYGTYTLQSPGSVPVEITFDREQTETSLSLNPVK
jgi:GH35 family endo-1,4-beta-xylanase